MRPIYHFICALLLAGTAFSLTACNDDDDIIVPPLDTSKSVFVVEEGDVRMEFYLTNGQDERTVVFHEGEDIFFNVDVTNLSDTTGIASAEAMCSYCHDRLLHEEFRTLSLQDTLQVAVDFLHSLSMIAWGTTELFKVYTSEDKFVGRPWSGSITEQIYHPIYGPDGQYHIKLPWYFIPGTTCRTGYITSYKDDHPTGGDTTYYAAEKIQKLKPGNYYAIAVAGAMLTNEKLYALSCRIDFQVVK